MITNDLKSYQHIKSCPKQHSQQKKSQTNKNFNKRIYFRKITPILPDIFTNDRHTTSNDRFIDGKNKKQSNHIF